MLQSPSAAEGFHQFAFKQSKSILSQTALPFSGGSGRMFASPQAAGRRITMGFSWMQRLGRGATIDLWFPNAVQSKLDDVIASGITLGDEHFPAEWAAVRQFELLQDAGNYKIYNMQVDYMMRSLYEQTRNMRGGGYRVTLVTLGSYSAEGEHDELEILDKRLQERLAQIIHMLYLDDQSTEINNGHDAALAEGRWNITEALPHIGMTLGSRDLFKPVGGGIRPATQTFIVPPTPHRVTVENWVANLEVCDAVTGDALRYTALPPSQHEYRFDNNVYTLAVADEGRTVDIRFLSHARGEDHPAQRTTSDKRQLLAKRFFDVLGLLPQSHIVHDTAIGLQLPEMINENEWLYIPHSEESVLAFNRILSDVFQPFDMMSLSKLDGREGATSEIKATTQHMRGYGDRFTPEAQSFQRQLAAFLG